ncbi:MAG: iron transporter [Lachnospiraceae bacterium]|nr:iron transporter [Lachnospiraceae bacterium]
MKKRINMICSMLLACTLLGGCADKDSMRETETAAPAIEIADAKAEETASETDAEMETEDKTEVMEDKTEVAKGLRLPDGIYTAEFRTDSGMFHVNEACEGKGTLTVKSGEMTIHISLTSKNILNLYPGLAEDAQKEGASLLMPTVDTVTYHDGMTEEVNGFDVPVPVLEEEFDLALIGKKGIWYDHKVSVLNPEPVKEETQSKGSIELADGDYTVELTFEGGSGKAKILSPATITVAGESMTAAIQWSSPNYDYMVVEGEKYLPVNTEGNSVFEIPVSVLDEPMTVIGDTVAMSTPHEIEYTLTFHSDTLKPLE